MLHIGLHFFFGFTSCDGAHGHLAECDLVNLDLEFFNLGVELISPEKEEFNGNDNIQKWLYIPGLNI